MSSVSENDGLDGAGRTPERASEPSCGSVLANRYEVQGLLGRGTAGVVYRVLDRRLDEVVALKLMRRCTDRLLQRFVWEVRLARRVTHPNVARIYDLHEHDGLPFVTMEYVHGNSLASVIERHRTTVDEAVRIAAQLAAGLEAAHAVGVVHRDLKPANVIIGDAGRVLLTDFGVARAQDMQFPTWESGVIVGTPEYMAPETVLGSTSSARADVYAFGLILYELLTGCRPIVAERALTVALMRTRAAPPDPRARTHVPDVIADLVLACLARTPESRPSAEHVRAVLEAFRASTQRGPRSTGFRLGRSRLGGGDALVGRERPPDELARTSEPTSPPRRNLDSAWTHMQAVLDESLPLGSSSMRRVGVDRGTGAFLVFDAHGPGNYHAHVRTWEELDSRMQAVGASLVEAAARGRELGLTYDALRPARRELLSRELASNDEDRMVRAMLSAALHEPDRGWVEDLVRTMLSHSRDVVREAAVLCVGHLARVHRAVDPDLAPLLRAMQGTADSPSGRVDDALSDIRIFAAHVVATHPPPTTPHRHD